MCTITALAACFSLSGFYIDGSVIHRDEGRGELASIVTQQATKSHEKILFKPVTTYTIDREQKDVYSVAAIGYSLTTGKVTARLEASREFIDGVNSVSFGITWRPFAK